MARTYQQPRPSKVPPPEPVPRFCEGRRRAVFAYLVAAQDRGARPDLARRAAAAVFGLSPLDVEQVEAEGLRRDWPLPDPPG